VTVRGGGAFGGSLRAALEDDASRALGRVQSGDVLSRCPHLPGAARWAGVLAAALLAALLVPARRGRQPERLADMLLDGQALVDGLESAAGEEGDAARPRAATARKVLVLIKAPPPKDPEEAARRRAEIERAAEEMRRRGGAELAAELEAVARALAARDGSAGNGDAAGGGTKTRSASGGEHYPEGYRELLARYFSEGF
jgi:hypothetical protein